MDEEWFSAVHVHIEAAGGAAVDAAVDATNTAHLISPRSAVPVDGAGAGGVIGGDVEITPPDVLSESEARLTLALEQMAASIQACTAALRRMEERCDPYIYYNRVRLFMTGWTSKELPPQGLFYNGVVAAPARDGAEDGAGRGNAAVSAVGVTCPGGQDGSDDNAGSRGSNLMVGTAATTVGCLVSGTDGADADVIAGVSTGGSAADSSSGAGNARKEAGDKTGKIGTFFRCFGETGAQSSLVPALDACLGIATDAGAQGDALVRVAI